MSAYSGLDIIISCHVCNSLFWQDLAASFICWKLEDLLHFYEFYGFQAVILSCRIKFFCSFVPGKNLVIQRHFYLLKFGAA